MSLEDLQDCARMDSYSKGDCHLVKNYLYDIVGKTGGRTEACGHAVKTLQIMKTQHLCS